MEKETLLPVEQPRRIVPERLIVNLLYMGSYIGLLLGSLPFQFWYIFAFPERIAESSIELILFATCLSIVCIAVPVIIWASYFPHARAALKLHKKAKASEYVLSIIVSVCLVITANCLTYYWMNFLAEAGFRFSLHSGIPSPQNPVELSVLILLIGLVPAVIEEMLFRGVMLESYLPMGRGWAIFLTSVLFAFMHGTVEALPAHLLAGLVLGVAVATTDSLRPGIIIHFLYNALLLVQDYISRNVWESKLFTLYLQDDWNALWPLALGAALALIMCLAGFYRSRRALPRLYVKRESGAVWLPMVLGFVLSIALYVGGLVEGFSAFMLEILR